MPADIFGPSDLPRRPIAATQVAHGAVQIRRAIRAFKEVMTVVSRRRFEKAATSIATLGRSELKRQIKNFRGRFKLDFTDAYLDSASVDRLRHILLAALITAKSHN